jgi:hypothetical protein
MAEIMKSSSMLHKRNSCRIRSREGYNYIEEVQMPNKI